jgi:hypothetical protein
MSKLSAASVLVDIATAHYNFGVSSDGETFGVPREGPKVVFMLRGGKGSLRARLARQYFEQYGKAPAQQALADALLVVEGIAQDGDEERLHMRVARHDGDVWVDLGDQTGQAVRITADGWTVELEAPVAFKRSALTAPLPVPERGGSLEELWRWTNLDVEDRPLVAAWLVAALMADIPHPVLAAVAEQGSGKTTSVKVLVAAVDPSPVPARKPPKDGESWVTAAAGSWIVAIDNVSDIPSWLSDSLCRAVTGDGDVRRRLYTDGDLHVFAFRRCIILNAIDLGTLRGDLADRILPIHIPRIPDDRRFDEEDLWPAWEASRPAVFGALCDLAASVIQVLPSVRLESKPRMADFARVLAAVDRVQGTDGLARYLEKQKSLAGDSLEGDAFVDAMESNIATTFSGTSAELLALVTPGDDGWRAPKGWPGNARAVTTLLHRQAPVLRKVGWIVDDDGGANHDNRIRWTVTPPEKAGNGDSRRSHNSQSDDPGESASHASNESGPSQEDVFENEEMWSDYLEDARR